jgi:hypothetical protein
MFVSSFPFLHVVTAYPVQPSLSSQSKVPDLPVKEVTFDDVPSLGRIESQAKVEHQWLSGIDSDMLKCISTFLFSYSRA